MPTKKTHLLPCPFCGGKGIIKKRDSSLPEIENDYFTVTCSNDRSSRKNRYKLCHANLMVIGDSEQEVANNWNTRH